MLLNCGVSAVDMDYSRRNRKTTGLAQLLPSKKEGTKGQTPLFPSSWVPGLS